MHRHWLALGLLAAMAARAQCIDDRPQYSDEPQFTVAGVTDNTYRGGHGSDSNVRSAEKLTQATAELSKPGNTVAENEERAGHPLEAVQELQRAAERDPSESNLFDWGVELLAHRAAQPAAEVFTKGARLFPHSIRMLLGLASARYAAGAYEQAAACFFAAADLAPNDPEPYLFLGKAQARQITDSEGYEERMKRFQILKPNDALADYYYAVTIWNRRHDLRARDLLKKTVSIDPRFALGYLQLGITEGQNYSSAILDYQKAIEIDPALREAHYRLAEAYRATGKIDQAKQEAALYSQLSKESGEKVQQFIVELRRTK